jgi:uncharacterized protein YecE (DUF72 family)
MAKRGSLHIGTSGWHYKHWVGPFYPEGTRPSAMLGTYAGRFSAVEINNSFYRLLSPKALEQWRAATPDDFVFTCKGSRFLTHMKKLKDTGTGIARFFERARVLGDKLKVVVFQLPPHWGCDAGRLDAFLAALPGGCRYAVELRDESWLAEAVYDVLRRHRAAFCIYDIAGRRSPEVVTSDFVYLRLHGPGERAYEGAYSRQRLRALADKIGGWRKSGRDCFVFFDNDAEAHAPRDALRLLKRLERD